MTNTPDALAQMIGAAQDAPAYFNKDSKIGDSITGIIRNVSVRQTRDFKTNKPESWEDGSPKQQIVVVLDSTDDKGEVTAHSVYVKWWGQRRKAFATAVVNGGSEAPEIGALLTVAFSGVEKATQKGMDDEKLFEYVYDAPEHNNE